MMKDTGDNNFRADDHLRMDGTAIFNFVQLEVPPLIDSVLDAAGATPEQVDFFLFHQPNRFMLQKLADKLKIPHSKVPMNVVEAERDVHERKQRGVDRRRDHGAKRPSRGTSRRVGMLAGIFPFEADGTGGAS